MRLTARTPGPLRLQRLPDTWEPADFQQIRLTPCAPTLGAWVEGANLSQPLSEELFAELDRALLEWKVLFFRDQHLSEAAQANFATRWGPLLDDQLVPTQRENPVENLVVFERNAEKVGIENEWHCDGSFRVEPPIGTVLRAISVPAVGGDTLFADTAAAYDNLPEDLREAVDAHTAVHDWSQGAYAEKYAERLEELRRQVPAVEHPVVRKHPVTGRKHLFVNRLFTQKILGLSRERSDALLARLCAQVDLPELQCRFAWRPGSVAFWDNQAVQHYGASDYFPQRRVLARATIARRRAPG